MDETDQDKLVQIYKDINSKQAMELRHIENSREMKNMLKRLKLIAGGKVKEAEKVAEETYKKKTKKKTKGKNVLPFSVSSSQLTFKKDMTGQLNVKMVVFHIHFVRVCMISVIQF